MNRAMLEQHLAKAEQHITLGSQHVSGQRERVAKLQRAGHDTAQARELLRQFEELLSMHVADRDRLRKELVQDWKTLVL